MHKNNLKQLTIELNHKDKPTQKKNYHISNTYNNGEFCGAIVILYNVQDQIIERLVASKNTIYNHLCTSVNMFLRSKLLKYSYTGSQNKV